MKMDLPDKNRNEQEDNNREDPCKQKDSLHETALHHSQSCIK